MFCLGAFADKNTNIVYNDFTRNFPFMSLDGNVCLFCYVSLGNQRYLCHTYLDWIQRTFWMHTQKNISVYKTLKGPYDWNHFPLAPLGTKAIIYKDVDTRASWAPRGMDAWMLGPSKDHY